MLQNEKEQNAYLFKPSASGRGGRDLTIFKCFHQNNISNT